MISSSYSSMACGSVDRENDRSRMRGTVAGCARWSHDDSGTECRYMLFLPWCEIYTVQALYRLTLKSPKQRFRELEHFAGYLTTQYTT